MTDTVICFCNITVITWPDPCNNTYQHLYPADIICQDIALPCHQQYQEKEKGCYVCLTYAYITWKWSIVTICSRAANIIWLPPILHAALPWNQIVHFLRKIPLSAVEKLYFFFNKISNPIIFHFYYKKNKLNITRLKINENTTWKY